MTKGVTMEKKHKMFKYFNFGVRNRKGYASIYSATAEIFGVDLKIEITDEFLGKIVYSESIDFQNFWDRNIKLKNKPVMFEELAEKIFNVIHDEINELDYKV